MNFRVHQKDDPEINLIAFIDVLLVILIFLMLSTTYSKFAELKVTLPTADAEPLKDRPGEIIVLVSADGRYSVNGVVVEGRNPELLAAGLRNAAGSLKEPMVIITADAAAAHQFVINVLDAARRAGLTRLTFATEQRSPGGSR
jgi:biopolymer transport protein ExbD